MSLRDPDTAIKPKRIQRQRVKGWRMPENTIYVGRPSKWGNPFTPENSSDVLASYRLWIVNRLSASYPKNRLSEIRGKNLACWCRLDQPCHADILLELANK